MKDYQSMTDQELDKASAEMILGFRYKHDQDPETYVIRMKGEEWSPTHKSSNQAERYLFPKLRDDTDRIDKFKIDYLARYINITVKIKGGTSSITEIFEDDDQINRTKTIAALEAFSKIGEKNE